MSVITAHAQPYPEFPDSAGRWKEVMITCWVNSVKQQPEYFRNYYTFISAGDTFIHDTLYFKLLENGYYKGALRQDSCKIFYRPFETDKEMMLYDFCITDHYYSPVFDRDFAVTRVDSIMVGGEKRRRIFFDDVIGYEVGQFWIEGIGSSGGLLKPESYIKIPTCEACCGGEQELVCFSDSGDLLYLNPDYYNCDSLLSGNPDIQSGESFSVYPNPSDGKFIVDLYNVKSIQIIELFSGKGELLKTICNPSLNTIELAIENPGLYLIRITINNKPFTRKIFINSFQ
jgi:hypothetical protein